MNLGRPQTIIVIARHLTDFYEFVKPRQEVRDPVLAVLLDRREEERRRWTETRGASEDSATGEAAGLTLRELNWLCSASAFPTASESCTRADGSPGPVHGSGMQLR